jgi:signal transduction histidine kinase/CheY-like chemotaxis protein
MRAIAEVATAVTTGDLTRSIAISARGEVAALKDNINEMIRHLRDTTQKNSDQDWLKTNLAKFSRMLQGQKDLLTVGRLILSELAPVVSAQHGVFYILDSSGEDPLLRLLASYAFAERKTVANRFKLGEGLVGQCALEKTKILLSPVPPDYIRISSGLGEAAPLNVIVMPVIFESQVKAVLELASLEPFNATHQAFLDQLAETIGIVLNTIEANSRTEDLLAQSQSLAKELQNQQEELRQTNQQLEEKAGLLAQQNVEVERKNQEIEQARQAIEEKASQLALTSKYKSEFLANMSHELRTPLNSLLILSDQLSKNPDGNLTDKQVEFSRTIHSSGNDLLLLINDILDLSKIESGTVSLDVTHVRFSELQRQTEGAFRPIAEAKGVAFELEFASDLPRFIQTDQKRLRQVLKNLLSNAFKFTERGSVVLAAAIEREGWNRENDVLNQADAVIAFSVTDTGIGIHPSKHQIIFEAFQQADGSTNRRYGGTGLGLAISREIAALLGGDLRVESALGQGSTFTLYLPAVFSAPKQTRKVWVGPAVAGRDLPRLLARAEDELSPAIQVVADDRDSVAPGENVLLIVDNDPSFAQLLLEVAREQGWKAVVSMCGASAVAQARQLQPSAVTLDIRLPDIDGWRVLQTLKGDLGTRHIPVQVISTEDEESLAHRLGAWSYLRKPIVEREVLVATLGSLREYVERASRDILLVAGGETTAEILDYFAEETEIRATTTRSAEEACDIAEQMHFDCIVVDAGMAPGSCHELVEELVQRTQSRGPDGRGTTVLLRQGRLGGTGPIPGDLRNVVVVDTTAALADATARVLHRRVESLPPTWREAIQKQHSKDGSLAGRRILIVDDDIRNIFALTSILERQGMDVVSTETGQAAVELLGSDLNVDAVLMDIMMPGMDGFDTIRAIRKLPERRSVPIIAVTAKAMKGDRERTLEAGAWDYLSKPVDTEELLRILLAWLQS